MHTTCPCHRCQCNSFYLTTHTLNWWQSSTRSFPIANPCLDLLTHAQSLHTDISVLGYFILTFAIAVNVFIAFSKVPSLAKRHKAFKLNLIVRILA